MIQTKINTDNEIAILVLSTVLFEAGRDIENKGAKEGTKKMKRTEKAFVRF